MLQMVPAGGEIAIHFTQLMEACTILEQGDNNSLKQSLKRWIRIIGGFAMLGVGTAGWLLPILPGWVFFIAGLVVLSTEFHWARKALQWLKNRLPKKSLQE